MTYKDYEAWSQELARAQRRWFWGIVLVVLGTIALAALCLP
jgi:hypothetical protein